MSNQQGPTRIATKPLPTTRNPAGGSIDRGFKVRGRGPREHRLIRVPGRGFVVRKRVEGPGLGVLLLMVGIGGMLADLSLEGFGRVAVVLGAILWCDRRHAQRVRQLQEAMKPPIDMLQWHKDCGYEEGYRDRMEEERPKLVDLNARREEVHSGAHSPAEVR